MADCFDNVHRLCALTCLLRKTQLRRTTLDAKITVLQFTVRAYKYNSDISIVT